MRAFDLGLLTPLFLITLLVVSVILALVLRVPAETLREALFSQEVMFAVFMSLQTSLLALVLALAAGVPAAYVLARRNFAGEAVVDTVLDIPLVMPPLVAGVGLLVLLSRSMLGAPLARWGLDILFSPAGIVIAQAFVAISVVVRSARAAFSAVDPGYGQAAATLGASPFRTWIWIELPLAARGIAAGAILAWSRALGEFGATLMVAGATRFKTETLPMAIYLNIATGEMDLAIACALVLLAIACGLLLMLRFLGYGGRAAG